MSRHRDVRNMDVQSMLPSGCPFAISQATWLQMLALPRMTMIMSTEETTRYHPRMKVVALEPRMQRALMMFSANGAWA
jgi:uncharacterized protein YqcC (DUF446 family)